jgi:hypothetical protein
MLACITVNKGPLQGACERTERKYIQKCSEKKHTKKTYTPSEQYPDSPRPFLIVRCTRNHTNTIILINLEKRILVSFSALIVFEKLIRTCFF